jgi:hypothetical protein
VRRFQRWKHEGREGDTPGKGRGRRSSPSIGVMVKWYSELDPMVFGGVDVAAVADSNGEASLQLLGVEGMGGGGLTNRR